MQEWMVILHILALVKSCIGNNMVKFSTNADVNIITGSLSILDTLSEPNTYCAVRCQNILLCGGFIYHSGTGQCDLLEGKPTQAQLQASPGDTYYETGDHGENCVCN